MSYDKKFSRDDWIYFQDWQRHILRSRPKIPAECRKDVLIAFCFALTVDSSAGRECFKSDVRLEKELGLRRKYLARYRWLAVELGWFVPSGNKRNRVEPLRVNIPAYQGDAPVLPDRLCEKPRRNPSAAVSRPPSRNPKVPPAPANPAPVLEDPWAEYDQQQAAQVAT